MRFLIDVCADSRDLRGTLIAEGHDVLPIAQRNPKTSDEEILALATSEQRTIITEDKDFGELIFLRQLPHPCIIRLVGMTVDDKVKAVLEMIQDNTDAIENGCIITVTPTRVRIRQ